MEQFPPLKAVLAFDAAMQRNSFALAAQDLNVTPGAVGQQIRNLELWLGTDLFIRTVRQVQPTASAVRYWDEVRPALARIHQASHALRTEQSSAVTLSMPPSLAAKWFARRMGRFLIDYPDIALHLSASTELTDFARHGTDLAIRHFDGRDDKLDAILLRADEARAYCSPAYAAQLKLASAGDVARATLLHTTMHPHWPEWLRRFAGLTAAQAAAIPGQHFDLALLAVEAARRGQGIVLCSELLVEEELEQGSLCEPMPLRLPLKSAYYVVHQRGAALRPPAQLLQAWLLQLS